VRAKRAKPKRSTLTRKERAEMSKRQGGLCFAWGCTGKPQIAEHWQPVALKNEAKPDCLLCADCARRKTYGSPGRVGGDIRDIKHIRKLEEKRTQADVRAERGPKLRSNSKLKSRGFDKSLSKKMNGEVIRNG
jgi:hypothetical protein